MAENHTQPKTLVEIIDQIERVREELLMVQNALEESTARCASLIP